MCCRSLLAASEYNDARLTWWRWFSRFLVARHHLRNHSNYTFINLLNDHAHPIWLAAKIIHTHITFIRSCSRMFVDKQQKIQNPVHLHFTAHTAWNWIHFRHFFFFVSSIFANQIKFEWIEFWIIHKFWLEINKKLSIELIFSLIYFLIAGRSINRKTFCRSCRPIQWNVARAAFSQRLNCFGVRSSHFYPFRCTNTNAQAENKIVSSAPSKRRCYSHRVLHAFIFVALVNVVSLFDADKHIAWMRNDRPRTQNPTWTRFAMRSSTLSFIFVVTSNTVRPTWMFQLLTYMRLIHTHKRFCRSISCDMWTVFALYLSRR